MNQTNSELKEQAIFCLTKHKAFKNTEGCEVLVLEDGFISVRVDLDENKNKFLYICDFFVSKKSRKDVKY